MLKYAIIGAGGTGGTLGFHLTEAGKDVTLIARGAHLAAMRENGLTMIRRWAHTRKTIPVRAMTTEEYAETPDVLLVCVKGYSLEGILPFLQRAAGPETVVIPILNLFGTGGRLQEKLPGVPVLDGCIYVASGIEKPGTILQMGEILRVVYGLREGQTISEPVRQKLEEMAEDFRESGIAGIFSDHVRRDCLKKFSYVSPMGAAGLFYDAKAKDFQQEGPQREMVKAMMREITALSVAMDCLFDEDMVKINLDILSHLDPASDTSMQRDVAAGGASEIDGLVYEVVRLGERFGVPVPTYSVAADLLAKRYGGRAEE